MIGVTLPLGQGSCYETNLKIILLFKVNFTQYIHVVIYHGPRADYIHVGRV